MFIQILILCIGLVLLYLGSELLVRGASSTGMLLNVRPVIVGLTIVSFATSAPELLVSVVAAFKGSEGISLGNILGSNVINIALVLGISAAIKPVIIKKQLIKFEIPYMVLISIIFWILAFDCRIERFDGIVLLFLLFIFLIYGIINAKKKTTIQNQEKKSLKKIFSNTIMMIIGIVMLAKGADFVVQKAILMAQSIGLSQTFIGISVVALGTSLPELATSAVAAAKGESDISVGNVVGSNLFNICLVMGMVGLLNPMDINFKLHYFEFPFMVFVSIFLALIAFFKKQVSRSIGYTFIFFFIVYLVGSYLK